MTHYRARKQLLNIAPVRLMPLHARQSVFLRESLMHLAITEGAANSSDPQLPMPLLLWFHQSYSQIESIKHKMKTGCRSRNVIIIMMYRYAYFTLRDHIYFDLFYLVIFCTVHSCCCDGLGQSWHHLYD